MTAKQWTGTPLQTRIFELLSQGWTTTEIAERLGCSRYYVSEARARIRGPCRQGHTLQSRIEARLARGDAPSAIAQKFGCRSEYVRAVRQRARRRVETGFVESKQARLRAAARRSERKAASNTLERRA